MHRNSGAQKLEGGQIDRKVKEKLQNRRPDGCGLSSAVPRYGPIVSFCLFNDSFPIAQFIA
jgi:hypothetical protein